ncbi:Hypothetical predicted protein, partial [Pelobates cultripes]
QKWLSRGDGPMEFKPWSLSAESCRSTVRPTIRCPNEHSHSSTRGPADHTGFQ